MEADRINLLKNEVNIWSLSSDNNLLMLLRNFSVKLSDRTRQLVSDIENVSSESIEGETKLRNTLNEFLMLSNTQFMENVSCYLDIVIFAIIYINLQWS